MTSTHPKLKPEIGHSVAIGQVEYLSHDMSPLEIIEVLDSFTYHRENHALLVDKGVREYLCDALRAHIQRKAAP